MHKTLLIVSLVIASGLGAISARAEKQRIAFVDLRLVNAPPALTSQVKEKLIEALRQTGHEVVLPNDADVTTCLAGPCLVEVGRSQNAAWVLTAGLSAHGTSYDILLTLQETSAGTLLAQVKRRCDVCTYHDAVMAVERAGKEVVTSARSFVDRLGWLVLSSRPSGADARLDGRELGLTPLRRLASGGRHRLSLTKGELGVTKTITIEPRSETVLELELRSDGAHPRDSGSGGRRSWRWLGLVIGGLGVGSGAAGAITWANDHDVPGAALVGAGISALVSGTIMFFTSYSD